MGASISIEGEAEAGGEVNVQVHVVAAVEASFLSEEIICASVR